MAAQNKFEAIDAQYRTLDTPQYSLNRAGNFPGMRITDILLRRTKLQNLIRETIRQWYSKYLWGSDPNWYKTVPVETYNDIYNWLTPERKEMLLREQIVRKSFINQFLEGIQKVVQQLGGVLSWPLLAPFKGAMKKGLQDAGYSTSGNLQDIATRFFENIVKKRGKPNNSEKFETVEPVSATVIIQAIIQFFTLIQKNAQNNSEEEMAKIAQSDGANAEALIRAEQMSNPTNTIDNANSSMKMNGFVTLILIGIGLIILYKIASK